MTDELVGRLADKMQRSVAWSSFWDKADAAELVRAVLAEIAAAGDVVVSEKANDAMDDALARRETGVRSFTIQELWDDLLAASRKV